MMKRVNGFFFAISCVVLIVACKSYEDQDTALVDTKDRGKIYVSADESFKPIIDEMVKVYESNHPGTEISVSYKAEADCLKDMFTDSIRMVITTKKFSEKESNLLSDSLSVGIQSMVVAKDAIAVIVHPQSEDTLLTQQELKAILEGKFKKNLIPVFDGVKATGTIRFIIDTLLRGAAFGSNVVAARSSEEVIDYISKTKNAIGFIGVSWIGNKEDKMQSQFLKKIKVVRLESVWEPNKYVLPVQANLFNKSYPMARDLIYMLKEKDLFKGLGNGFANFMTRDQGQLILKKAYLMPTLMDFSVRKAVLND